MEARGSRSTSSRKRVHVSQPDKFREGFVPPFVPGQACLGVTRRATCYQPSCPNVATFMVQPSAPKRKPQPQRNATNYAMRKTARPRGRPPIMKEVLNAQRLRKQGNWRDAKRLLSIAKHSAQKDPNYLNESLHVRAAELRYTNPTLSATDLYNELYSLSESLPARSNCTTFNAILLGLRNRRESGEQGVQSAGGSELEVASHVFDTMVEKRLYPDHYTMSILFQMCASGRSRYYTKNFEQRAKDVFGFQANVISGSSLLSAYAKCGDLESVEAVLEDLQKRNVLLNERTYASVISAYHRCGRHSKVMECYQAAMNSTSVQPNVFIFSGTLASCSKARDAANARLVFEAMMLTNTRPTEDILCTLFETAVRSGDIELGINVLFDSGPKYSLLTPSLSHVARLISACKKSLSSSSKILTDIKTILTRMTDETNLSPNVSILNSLVSTYVGLGAYGDAQKVLSREFSRFGLTPDVVTYNTLIHSLGRAKRPELAIRALEVMRKNGVSPDVITYNTLLDVAIEGRNLDMARMLIQEMKKDPGIGMDSVGILSQLKIFKALKDPKGALGLYRRCLNEGNPMDSKAHGLLLTILFDNGKDDDAISVFGWLVWKRLATVIVFNVVLDYVGRESKNHERCFAMFRSMKNKGIAPDEITYSTLIQACSRSGLVDKAFRLLGEMQDVGLGMMDTYAWTALIDGCGRVGQWQRAVEVLKSMYSARGAPDATPAPTTACYNAAIYASGMRGGGWKAAVEVYGMLLADENQEPDNVTYSAMASTILSNRFDIREWGIVRDVCQKLKEVTSTDADGRDGDRVQQRASGSNRKMEKGVQKKLLAKMKRVEWVLRQADEGKLLGRGRSTSGDSKSPGGPKH